MRKALLLFFFYNLSITAKSQTCNRIFVGNDTAFSCSQPCFTLKAKIPDIRSSSDYKVVSTAYQPFPFTSGIELKDPVANVYIDDKFSDSVDMTFPFCFYGDIYSKCTVGSNGVITFDVVTNSRTSNAYAVNLGSAGLPIPYAGGTPNVVGVPYYPRASIMGAYHDIDPSANSNPPPDTRIEYSIVGTSPCRKFIVTYYKVPMWSPSQICHTLLCTQQIVLNESTGIIDVYFENKPICSSWVTAAPGLAILGVQNWARDQAVAAPGKNATQWTAVNEGYSFIPSGGASLLKRVELYKNGVLVNTGTAVSNGNGQMDVSFLNVCQIESAVDYVVKAFYQSCSNPAIETEASDTIAVTRNAGPMTASATGVGCTTNTGTITVTSPVGPLYEYSIDGVAWQPSPIFVVAAGTYTIRVRLIGNTACVSSTVLTLSINNTLVASANTTNSSCAGGSPTGTITVIASLGTPPYTYSLDGGTPQLLNVFTSVTPGPHLIQVKDVTGCTYNFFPNVGAGTNITASAVVVNASCGIANGTITVTPLSGTGPYQYSICALPCAGGTFQPSNVFTGLAPGDYLITVKDIGNCTVTFNKTVVNNAGGFTATATSTPTGCSVVATGSITVTPTSGTAPYTYSLNGGAAQIGNTFAGLAAGNYTILITDATGCTTTLTQSVSSGSGITATATSTNTGCGTATTGSITITPSAGTTPYAYSLDGGIPQPSNIFTGLAAGIHTILVKDAAGCSFSFTQNVANGGGITATTTAVNTACGTATTGSITVTPVGTAPYTYSLNGGAPQASNIFNGLAAGNYTILVTDANTCTVTVTQVVASNSGVTATASSTNTACGTATTGTITVTSSAGVAPYNYSIDGGTFQPSNIFNGLAAGSHSILIKDAAGCTFILTQSVGTGAGITATATATNTGCGIIPTGTITVTPSSGILPYTYSLNGGTPQGSNTFTALAGGSYSILVKDAAGCTFTLTQTVGVSSGISATAISTNTACGTASSGTIVITPAGGAAPYTYSLNGGTLQGSNTFAGLATGSYTILVKDAAGCTFTLTQTVVSNPGVTATQVSTNAGCPGSATGTITVNATLGIAPYTYSLNGGAFQPSNVFNALPANTYNVQVKDAVNCVFSLTAVVGNNPLVTATLNITEPSCNGTATGSILVNALLGTSPYQYALNAGGYQAGNNFNNLIAGNYIVHIKDATGCIKDSTVVLTQPNVLGVITDTTTATCVGTDGTITLTASGGTLPYLYSKDNGTNYQTSNSFIVNPGTYNMTVKDNRGCIFNSTAIVRLIDDMFLDIGNDTTSCSGIPLTITPSTNSGTNIFNWTPNNGTLKASTGAYTVTPADTTTYFLTAMYGNCQRTDQIKINVLRKPVADAGSDTIICDRTTAFLHGSASNLSGTVNYLWSPGSDLQSTKTDTTTAIPSTNGPHTYTLQVSDNYGCNFNVTDAVVVTMNPPPPAFAGNDTVAAMNLPHQLFGRGGVSYAWSPGGVLNDPFIQNPVAILGNDTRFYLKVTDNGGCTGFDTVDIKVYVGPAYYIPNAFTPNGDGLNDEFKAIPPGIVKTDYFRIFNRWGEMLFETHQYMKGWDGTFIGKPQPAGPYVWIIKGVDKYGKVIQTRGTVMLIR